jgi:hypothetical protein
VIPQSPTLLHYTGYDECDLTPCVQEIENFMSDATSNLTVCAPADPYHAWLSTLTVLILQLGRP